MIGSLMAVHCDHCSLSQVPQWRKTKKQ